MGGCEDPHFPDAPWADIFGLTSLLPPNHLTLEQRDIQMRAYREALVRTYEYWDYNNGNLFKNFLNFDRKEAVAFAEQQWPDIHMAQALLDDYQNQSTWDDLRRRECKLLLSWTTQVYTTRGYITKYSALENFDSRIVKVMMDNSPDPSLRDDFEASADRIIEFYEEELHDEVQDEIIKNLETWRDNVLDRIDDHS